METTMGICGTAGRRDDANRLSKNHFEAMYECAHLMLEQFKESDYGVNTLISGGSSWADHSAVKLFLNKEVPHLKLFLPCPFLTEARQFDPTPLTSKEAENKRSTGETLNALHFRFSQKVGFNSLNEILLASQRGAEIITCKGFYQRNACVAQSDILLAMTFGDLEWVKDGGHVDKKTGEYKLGGTAFTVQAYLNRVKKLGTFDKSFHYCLSDGNIYAGCRVRTEI